MDVWQCGLLPTLASSSSNSHVCFVALKFLELTYCQSQLQKKTELPRAARLCLSLSKLKLYINQFKKVQPSKKKRKQNASTFYLLDFFPGEMKSNWNEVFEAHRCFASSTLSEEAMPVTSVASKKHHPQVDGRFGSWHSDIPRWFVLYVSTCLPTACYIVIWFEKCITNQLPPSFFSRQWSNNEYSTSTSTMSECLWVFQYFSVEKRGISSQWVVF